MGRVHLEALRRVENVDVVEIAATSADKAKAAAAGYNVLNATGDWRDVMADPSIDAVHVTTPNVSHYEIAKAALEAGKHVLCEKPIGLTAAEGQLLVDAGRRHPQLKLMEAFMYRHHPQWLRAQELVRTGAIGALRTIHSFFSYHNADALNIRNMADIGGGGLMDIGCYNISLARFIFGGEPRRVCGLVEYDPQFKTDRLASGMLDFGTGSATFTCSTQLAPFQRASMYGTTGSVTIEIPFNAPPDRPCKLWHQHADGTDEIVLETCDQYTLQGDLFSLAVRNNTAVPTPIEDAVANMRVIEAVVHSAKTSRWIDL